MEKRGFRRVFVFHATDADMNMFHEELVHEAHRSDYVVSSQRVGNNLPYKERRAMYAETGEARPVVVSSSLPFDEEMGLDPDLPAADMVVILRGCTDTLTALTLVLDLLAKPSPGKRSGFIMVPLTKQQASAESGALPKAAVVALAALVQHGGPRLFESLKQFAQRRAMLGRLLSSTEWPEELQTVLDLESEVSAEAIFHVADLAASRLAPAWSSKLGLLMAFRLREGSVEVPAKHAESGVELHKWLREQHAAALQGQLDEEQLQQLRALGVELAVDCEARVTEEWERRFRQLEDFHHAEGGSDVEGLSRWLKMQRSRAKRGSLKKKQRLRLSQLGVNFEQPGV
ncbi:unnamed protein product [Polarella glacialis]|uniref:Helicase-associated domain-containing protein n=1 Tax=Polarella glacialis TaxID=89957 RepID=A0A813GX95_POLGL|nr:unnamed protein product [Polarella glacialis]CAE8629897.1 unnamed protein product [Polarella glacialis]